MIIVGFQNIHFNLKKILFIYFSFATTYIQKKLKQEVARN